MIWRHASYKQIALFKSMQANSDLADSHHTTKPKWVGHRIGFSGASPRRTNSAGQGVRNPFGREAETCIHPNHPHSCKSVNPPPTLAVNMGGAPSSERCVFTVPILTICGILSFALGVSNFI